MATPRAAVGAPPPRGGCCINPLRRGLVGGGCSKPANTEPPSHFAWRGRPFVGHAPTAWELCNSHRAQRQPLGHRRVSIAWYQWRDGEVVWTTSGRAPPSRLGSRVIHGSVLTRRSLPFRTRWMAGDAQLTVENGGAFCAWPASGSECRAPLLAPLETSARTTAAVTAARVAVAAAKPRWRRCRARASSITPASGTATGDGSTVKVIGWEC
jgi:hypothetical protein